MASEWNAVAVAAVTGLTTIVSGSLGYLLGAQQSRAQERQAAQARRDTQQAKRGETYHSFLDVDRELASRLGAGLNISPEKLEQWLPSFDHCYNAVILLGSDEVSERARDLFKGYLELHTALKGEGNAWPTVKEQQAVWSERQGGLDKARKRLIDAMRRDVFASGERRPSRAGTPRGELDSGS